MKIYLIGALKNPDIPLFGNKLRELGFDVFDDWWGAGPKADDHWREYENIRGRSYHDALQGHAARNIFQFDNRHLLESDMAILMLPAGRSGHLEFGFMVGQGKQGYVLFDKVPKKYDVMYCFADEVFFAQEDLLTFLKGERQ